MTSCESKKPGLVDFLESGVISTGSVQCGKSHLHHLPRQKIPKKPKFPLPFMQQSFYTAHNLLQDFNAMTRDNYVFWDLGESMPPIHPSSKSLARILDGLIRCHGRLHDSHCLELDSSGNYRYPTASCAVLFRISLPEGEDISFAQITGFRLSVPPRVHV